MLGVSATRAPIVVLFEFLLAVRNSIIAARVACSFFTRVG